MEDNLGFADGQLIAFSPHVFQQYAQVQESPARDNEMIAAASDDVRQVLDNCLTDARFPELPNFQQGKVRDSYDLPDGRRVMIATDRQSAFDYVLAAVPFKGQVLNQTAMFWFDKTKDICPNHVIEAPDPNVVIARRLDMLPVEMVVRDYITGTTETSIWPMYERGERDMYGQTLDILADYLGMELAEKQKRRRKKR